MNKKSQEQRDAFYNLTATSIFNFLQENKDTYFNGGNVTNFKIDYDKRCKEKKIRSYQHIIGKHLWENNLLQFKGNRCIIKNNYTQKEFFEIIKNYNNRTNQGNKKAVSKRGIKRVVPKLKNEDLQPEQKSNLIPKEKFLDSMTTLEIINYLLKNRKILIKDDIIYTPVL